jgi:putative MATE family efflux protein
MDETIEGKSLPTENIMGTLPVGRLLMKMSVPVILSMMVSSLYSIIDSIFVSRLGENALTAMSLATPISSLLACITVGFSVGMNAVLSRKLGEGNQEAAGKAAGNGLLVNWIVAILFMMFGLFLTRPFYALQTDVLEIQQLGYSYTSIVCIFCFGVANQTMLERMLVATGKPLGSVFALTTGTVVNLILDPVLIFGYFGAPALGMRGAAIATVIAQFAAAAVALVFNLAVNKELNFHLGMLRPHGNTLRQIWNVGFPAALQQSISPLMVFGLNQILLGFTTAAPAVYVIYVRLQSIVLIPIWGLKNTVVSIISYNYGAGYRERIRKTIRICLIATVIITLAGVAIFQAIPNLLLALFNAQGEVLAIGTVALRIISFVFPFSGLTLILGSFFQALGHSSKTLITSASQFVLMLATAMILAHIGTVYTVWFAFVITEVLVAGIAIFLMHMVTKATLSTVPDSV